MKKFDPNFQKSNSFASLKSYSISKFRKDVDAPKQVIVYSDSTGIPDLNTTLAAWGSQ